MSGISILKSLCNWSPFPIFIVPVERKKDSDLILKSAYHYFLKRLDFIVFVEHDSDAMKPNEEKEEEKRISMQKLLIKFLFFSRRNLRFLARSTRISFQFHYFFSLLYSCLSGMLHSFLALI